MYERRRALQAQQLATDLAFEVSNVLQQHKTPKVIAAIREISDTENHPHSELVKYIRILEGFCGGLYCNKCKSIKEVGDIREKVSSDVMDKVDRHNASADTAPTQTQQPKMYGFARREPPAQPATASVTSSAGTEDTKDTVNTPTTTIAGGSDKVDPYSDSFAEKYYAELMASANEIRRDDDEFSVKIPTDGRAPELRQWLARESVKRDLTAKAVASFAPRTRPVDTTTTADTMCGSDVEDSQYAGDECMTTLKGYINEARATANELKSLLNSSREMCAAMQPEETLADRNNLNDYMQSAMAAAWSDDEDESDNWSLIERARNIMLRYVKSPHEANPEAFAAELGIGLLEAKNMYNSLLQNDSKSFSKLVPFL